MKVFKKGDFVQVWQPCAAQIKRINKKSGYTLTVFPSMEYETSYYIPEDLIKIEKSDLYKYVTEEFLKKKKKVGPK